MDHGLEIVEWFDIFVYSDEHWEERISTILELVKYCSPKFRKKAKKRDQELRSRFVYDYIGACFESEDSLYNELSAKQRINLWLNMEQIKSKLIKEDFVRFLPEFWETEYKSWFDALGTGLRNVMYEILSFLLKDLEAFSVLMDEIVSGECVPPLEDLTEFEDGDGFLKCEQYVDHFNKQLVYNYDRLNNLSFTLMRFRMKDLAENIKQAYNFGLEDSLFTRSMKKKLIRLHRMAIELKENLDDKVKYLHAHHMFVQNLMENIHIESFSEQTMHVAEYYLKHQEEFDSVFGPDANVEYPFDVLYISELREVKITCKSQTEYDLLANTYQCILGMLEKLEQVTPVKYPQSVPNLSTHDAKPYLLISCREDYISLMSSYCSFITKMDTLKKDWKFTTKSLIEFLMNTQVFLEYEG
eukprot:TRINITY_DN9696_c0_g1_i1.p1 TRINITY_DN9696_c0_g1~~TRINITY_DN9696_c0_g1_i1.p1  ORF type:complete len:413 (+),score=75.26 TRINITY_DN9696_c0_g1_i1:191-1429(+)